jgi:tRNA threonylcarbamoyladenosine biosynthesis protein TsaE
MTIARTCSNDEKTQRAGEDFGLLLRVGDIILLTGRLGAGKTTFTKGVARALGVKERVTSPTFTMVRQHGCHNSQGIKTLHHGDMYRIESAGEVADLALGELVEEEGVAVVEWGELASEIFGPGAISIHFEVHEDESRTLSVHGEFDETRQHEFVEWAKR